MTPAPLSRNRAHSRVARRGSFEIRERDRTSEEQRRSGRKLLQTRSCFLVRATVRSDGTTHTLETLDGLRNLRDRSGRRHGATATKSVVSNNEDACVQSTAKHTIAKRHDTFVFVVLPDDVDLGFGAVTIETRHFSPLKSVNINLERAGESGWRAFRRTGQIRQRALLQSETLIGN